MIPVERMYRRPVTIPIGVTGNACLLGWRLLTTNSPMTSLASAHKTLNKVLLGKETQIRLCLVALLVKGHVLFDDVPGVGKTTLALALAKVTGLNFRRLQFTNDLLPADVTGYGMVEDGKWTFREGPVFTDILLADEVNRASPHSQSALLEAMEERQVSVDRTTHKLPDAFFVIATQNPSDQIGTNALPESQMDRFLFSIALGCPSRTAELQLLAGGDRRKLVTDIECAFAPGELAMLQGTVDEVKVSTEVLEYMMALILESRKNPNGRSGLSPRAGIALRRAAQASAMLDDRTYVTPDDVQIVFPSIAAHRLTGGINAEQIIRSVRIP